MRTRTGRIPTKSKHLSVDMLWAGIDPMRKCSCGHTASDHIVTLRKSTPTSYRCEANCRCRTWDDGFGRH